MVHMGSRLQKRLKDIQMTQRELAERLGCTRQQIGNLVHNAAWRGKTIDRVADALGVEPGYFFRAS